MIYLDTSVALAELFAEDRRPSPAFWTQSLVSSRLLEYEVWCRVHARGATLTHEAAARELLSRVAFVELAPPVLTRALEPFPAPVRTLDALHLATAMFLASRNQSITLAAYDQRMQVAGKAVGLGLAEV